MRPVTYKTLALGLPLLLASAIAGATLPLFDKVVIDGKSGNIFPEKCCWMPLPKTEKLIQARRAENCSAIGGPVGVFEVADGKLWLTGLSKCAGPLPLKNIYPELRSPAPATWLSGRFTAYTDYQCTSSSSEPVFRTKTVLVVDAGSVASATSEQIDASQCRPAP